MAARKKYFTEEEKVAGRALAVAKYRSSEKYREVSRAGARRRRAAETPEHRNARLEKRRADTVAASPEVKAHRSVTLRRIYERKVASGICVGCTKLATVGLRCMDHWFDCIGRSYGLTMRNGGAEFLRELWDVQRGLCALTGEAMVQGQNATIDHIVPCSRGGSSDKTNLQWVTRRANQAKNDLTTEEFVELCRAVVQSHKEGRATNVVPIRKAGAK